MKLNNLGKKIYDEWYEKYCAENDRLGGNSSCGDFVDGWCIIDNIDYIKTKDDAVGLMIFGYDGYALDVVNEWIDDEFVKYDSKVYDYMNFTFAELIEELKKYYE